MITGDECWVTSRASLLVIFLGAAAQSFPQAPPPSVSPALFWDRRPLRVPLSCRTADLEAAFLQCSDEEPCRVFLELTAIEAVGPKILAVGNLHTSSATVSSIALLSEDAGTTWREPVARVPGAGLASVQFFNDLQGWIAVQPHGQFPHDPYLLATANGGKNWEPLRIWSEEGRYGLLQQFYFDSRERGWVLIDRSSEGFELYETLNAGVSWMLKETNSRPITPKWPARRSPDWRLRVDEKLRTYEVERRVGEAWRRMANFGSEVGECKTPEPVVIPAPAPPPPENP